MFLKQKTKIEQWIKKHEKLYRVAMKERERFYHTKKRLRYTFAFSHPSIMSFSGTVSYVVDWTKRLPSDFDVIIGTPRSGLWIANIIALRFGKPLSTPENFIRGEIWHTSTVKMDLEKCKKILLVDDTVNSGRKITDTIQKLKAFNVHLDIYSAAFMVTNKGKKLVDYYYMMLKDPHLFEWNLLSANVHIDSVATDLDGVLCHDCPPEADDDGEKYANWIKNVLPYMIPNFTIETIITSRLEKYRTQTEEWLKSYKVKYKQLVMLNDQTRNSKKSVSHKVSVIKKTKPLWFFESDFSEAEEIQRKTKCKVVCVNDL